MTDDEKVTENDFRAWAAESQYGMANDLQKAVRTKDWETAERLVGLLIEGLEGNQRGELYDNLQTLTYYVILWTQARPDQREGEWLWGIKHHRRNVAYLQVEQPKFDEKYMRKEVVEVYQHAAEKVTYTDLEPFGIRRPTWEQLFINDYSWDD